MHHPESLLIPVLMLCDYWLTVAGARAREGVYADHFKTQHYELNPVWQTAIARKRWFNPRHVGLTLAITAVFCGVGETLLADDPVFDFVIGALFVVFGAVNGRHLSNLATFAWIRRHPDELSGSIAMSHGLTLWLSTFQYLVLLLPLALLAICAPTPHVLGGLVGGVLLISVHLSWIRRWRRQQRTHQTSAAPPPERAPLQLDAASEAESADSSVPSSSASATNLP